MDLFAFGWLIVARAGAQAGCHVADLARLMTMFVDQASTEKDQRTWQLARGSAQARTNQQKTTKSNKNNMPISQLMAPTLRMLIPWTKRAPTQQHWPKALPHKNI